MRVGLFYISSSTKQTASSLDRQRIHTSTGSMWIRVEEVSADDEASALDYAKPYDDETFMNAHELPERP